MSMYINRLKTTFEGWETMNPARPPRGAPGGAAVLYYSMSVEIFGILNFKNYLDNRYFGNIAAQA